MTPWARNNKGMKWMLNIIDVWSRYAWSVPMKTKTAKEVLAALKGVIDQSGRKPKFLWTDLGKEFVNQWMARYLDDNNVTRYSTFGDHKSMMVERLNRSLKEEMWRRFTQYQTNVWVDRHKELIDWYNNRQHSSLDGRTPDSVSGYDDFVPLDVECITAEQAAPKFQIGDTVRISTAKGIFEKGYTANWSQEQFTVIGTLTPPCGDPVMYTLMDWEHKTIDGNFYAAEMQGVKFPNVYIVDKIIKRDAKKKQILVQWIGLPSKYNEWVPESEVLE